MKKEKSAEKSGGPELTSSEALLNKLESYIGEVGLDKLLILVDLEHVSSNVNVFELSKYFQAIDKKQNTQRKVLDALLGAINVQVGQVNYDLDFPNTSVPVPFVVASVTRNIVQMNVGGLDKKKKMLNLI